MAKKRIGVHVGTSGGCWTAVQRAVDAGANTFQFFSSSPRTWKTSPVKPEEAVKMREARAKHDVNPIVIHASYLINLCSQVESVRANSVSAFRGEVERALAWGAEYLVLHPGSWNGLTREEGLRLAVEGIERATDGLPWQDHNFKVLIENTAGAEFSLGATLEQVAELVERLRACAPVGVCLDTWCGFATATMRRRRRDRSWTGMSMSARGRLGRRRFVGCCTMSGLRTRRSSRRRL
jgi:deoxyribonuclease-4